jgi:hypothetical protein
MERQIKLELIITNTDEIFETAKRLNEISKELLAIGYKLQAKMGAKEQPEG